jgi:hypothetical protein
MDSVSPIFKKLKTKNNFCHKKSSPVNGSAQVRSSCPIIKVYFCYPHFAMLYSTLGWNLFTKFTNKILKKHIHTLFLPIKRAPEVNCLKPAGTMNEINDYNWRKCKNLLLKRYTAQRKQIFFLAILHNSTLLGRVLIYCVFTEQAVVAMML